jgi:U3 small nucleolar RNA-associated protein 21
LVPPRERVAVAAGSSRNSAAATRPRAAAATSVCLSACGNFALVGSSRGHVDRYNMQSGRWRQAYRRRVVSLARGGGGGGGKGAGPLSVLLAHDGAVSGLAADVGCGLGGLSFDAPPSASSAAASSRRGGAAASPSSGRRAVSAGGADGFLRVWNFVTGELEGAVAPSPLPGSSGSSNSPVHAMAAAARPEGGGGGSSGCALVAAATDDGKLSVVDAERCRVVRRLLPPPGRISDLALSSDGRTLVASCLDGCVAAWDVVAGAALQRVSLLGRGSPVASLALSPDGEMLATAHFCARGKRSSSSSSSSSSSGVRLWANQAVFGEGLFDGCGGGNGSGGGWKAVRAQLPLPPAAPSSAAAADDDEENEDDDDDGDDEEDAEDPAAPGWLSSGGKNLTGDRAWGAGGGGGGDSSDDDEGSSSEEEEGEADEAAPTAPAATAAADETLPDGAPAPFRLFFSGGSVQPLATTSALPRARWAVLPHLDALAARNRPTEPPKKPEAAPFFLPTLPTLDGRPTFAVDEEEGGGEDGAGPEGPSNSKRSRVERGFAGNGSSAAGGLVAALRAGRKKASAASCPSASSSSPSPSDLRASLDAWSLASKWLRTARPHEVDRELRSMLVLEPDSDDDDDDGGDGDDGEEEEDGGENGNGNGKLRKKVADDEAASVAAAADAAAADLESLLLFLRARCASGADFELTQAFLSAALALHGGSIAVRPRLRRAAAQLERAVRASWERLDDSLHAVRCSAAYVGGLPS